MLSVRNLIAGAAFILVSSVVVGAISLTRPPDSGGAGGDSYGTRAHGYRALFDTLNEIGIETTRSLHPPTPPANNATLLLLAPKPELVSVEPAYLKSLLPWVEGGGRIVVAVRDLVPPGPAGAMPDQPGRQNILEILGLGAVDLMPRSPADGSVQPGSAAWQPNLRPLEDVLRESWAPPEIPPRELPVTRTGTAADDAWPIASITVPGDQVGTMDASDAKPSGVIDSTFANSAVTLAACFPRGKGEIVLLAEPKLFSNQFLARSDNSLLAVRLLSPASQPVIVDEFYHGLSVRGNPLWLLTRPGYGALAIGLLLTAGVVIWREAVFLGPPLGDESTSRRDVTEYIRAMGRFFAVGPESRRFLVTELRHGVLRELSVELSLPPDRQDVELTVAMLARRDPARAESLKKAIRDADALLATRQSWTEVQTLDVMRSLSSCLSKNESHV